MHNGVILIPSKNEVSRILQRKVNCHNDKLGLINAQEIIFLIIRSYTLGLLRN